MNMKWYVLYTRPHHERVVRERLIRKDFEVCLPMARVWRISNGVRRTSLFPLFPQHVFVRCFLDMYTHLELITTPGVTRLREDPRDGFLVVSDEEVHTLQQVMNAGVSVTRAPYRIQGQHVQVARGPLREVAGFIRGRSHTTLLVPIPTLKEGVAVHIRRADVIPCAEARGTLARSGSSDG
jgi:transcription antitermination factor NusG